MSHSVKVLKNERAWVRWESKNCGRSQGYRPEGPLQYPCVVVKTCVSFGMEESGAEFLYESDIDDLHKKLLNTMTSAQNARLGKNV